MAKFIVENVVTCFLWDTVYINLCRYEDLHMLNVTRNAFILQLSNEFLSTQSCHVSAVVAVDAELEKWSVDDVELTEDVIVSQWRDISANEQHQLHEQVDEMLRPLGFETRLLVIRRANSLALYFLCLTLSAIMSLRDQWRSQQLREIVEKLFTFLSGATDTVYIKRLTWPVSDYERCLEFFSSLQGKLMILSYCYVQLTHLCIKFFSVVINKKTHISFPNCTLKLASLRYESAVIFTIKTRSQAVARIADRTASQQALVPNLRCTAHETPCSQLDKFPVTLSQHYSH